MRYLSHDLKISFESHTYICVVWQISSHAYAHMHAHMLMFHMISRHSYAHIWHGFTPLICTYVTWFHVMHTHMYTYARSESWHEDFLKGCMCSVSSADVTPHIWPPRKSSCHTHIYHICVVWYPRWVCGAYVSDPCIWVIISRFPSKLRYVYPVPQCGCHTTHMTTQEIFMSHTNISHMCSVTSAQSLRGTYLNRVSES